VTTHLAETSVLTRLSVAAVRGALQPFIDAVALARCTLTDLELGFSASSASDWDRLQAVLTTLTSVEVTPVVISRAKSVQRMLAAGGLKGRKVPDVIIAAAAELTGLTGLRYDNDFELIASVTGQPHEWVVSRGSIDLRRKCRLQQASLRCERLIIYPAAPCSSSSPLHRLEDLVHHLGPGRDHRAQFPPVDDLGSPRASVPGQPGDLLDRHALVTHHADERGPQLLRHPARPEPSRRSDPPEVPPQVMRLILRPHRRGEHKPVLLPHLPGLGPLRRLPPADS